MVIDNQKKQFRFYDSLQSPGRNYFKPIVQWYVQYLKTYDADRVTLEQDWTFVSMEDIPLQENGWDCGVFLLMYADFEAFEVPLTTFDLASSMKTLRTKIAADLMRGNLHKY